MTSLIYRRPSHLRLCWLACGTLRWNDLQYNQYPSPTFSSTRTKRWHYKHWVLHNNWGHLRGFQHTWNCAYWHRNPDRDTIQLSFTFPNHETNRNRAFSLSFKYSQQMLSPKRILTLTNISNCCIIQANSVALKVQIFGQQPYSPRLVEQQHGFFA